MSSNARIRVIIEGPSPHGGNYSATLQYTWQARGFYDEHEIGSGIFDKFKKNVEAEAQKRVVEVLKEKRYQGSEVSFIDRTASGNQFKPTPEEAELGFTSTIDTHVDLNEAVLFLNQNSRERNIERIDESLEMILDCIMRKVAPGLNLEQKKFLIEKSWAAKPINNYMLKRILGVRGAKKNYTEAT